MKLHIELLPTPDFVLKDGYNRIALPPNEAWESEGHIEFAMQPENLETSYIYMSRQEAQSLLSWLKKRLALKEQVRHDCEKEV